MGKMRTRMGVVLLVCMMLLCVLPVTALAGDEPTTIYVNATYNGATPSTGTEAAPYTTLEEAIQKANENDEIKLLSDVTVSLDSVANNSAAYVINKNITLDGNDKTITATATTVPENASATKKHVILASDGAKVEIKNLTVDGADYAKHGIQAYTAPGSEEQTKLTLNNVTSKNNMGYGVVVNASNIEATELYTSGNGWGGVNVDAKAAKASFSMSSGNIAEESSVILDSAENGENTLSITGGKFGGYVGANPDSDQAKGNDTITVENGTFEAAVAFIDNVPYYSLEAAIEAAVDGDTIKLQSDATGCGIVIDSSKYADKGLTIDFGENTYTVDREPLAGSSNTKNQCFQLLTGGSVIMKNGTVKTTHSEVRMIIQNYCNLTLDKMNVDGSGMTGTGNYTMSNNCGNVVIQDSTITAKDGDVAFDVYGGFGNYDDVTVTVKGTSVINGTVEVARDTSNNNTNTLNIEGGTFNGNINGISFGSENTKIEISGGTYSTEIPEEYCADGFVLVKNEDGTYGVEPEAVATKITLDETSLTLVKGDTATLTATVEPAEATNKDEIVWTTSNSDIATVEAGKITAVGYGTATITAKIGEVYATCAVSVICDDENCAYYDDVNEDAWYHAAVDFVTEHEIMQGIGNKTFAPEGNLTRAQFAQILYNMEGKPQDYETDKTFSDVHEKEDDEDVWYYDAVMWAASTGVVKGYEDDCYYPDKDITRQEMVTMLYRYAEYKSTLTGDITEDLEAFPDSNDNSVWDDEAFAWAVQHGIVNGKDGKLAAGDPARRCEIAKIIMVYMSLV